MMNYPVTIASIGFFANEHLNMDVMERLGNYRDFVRPLTGFEFSDRIKEIYNWYSPAVNQVQMNLLESHDTPRFITSVNGDVDSYKLAALFMFTIPGAPTIYYGSEIGLDGYMDPDCRKSFPWEEHKWDKDLLSYMQGCIKLRTKNPALMTGEFNFLLVEEDTCAFERILENERILVCFNVADEFRQMVVPGKDAIILFGQADIINRDDQIELRIGPRQGVVIKG